MAKMRKKISRIVKDRLKMENRTSPGSVRRGGRNSMEMADQMSTGRRRNNQSTDSSQ